MKNNWIFFLFIALFFNSCKMQEKDLANLEQSENYKEILKDKKIFTEPYDIAAKLPIAYTYDTKGYRFGVVDIPENTEDQVSKNLVGIFLNNVKDRKIVGVKIFIDGSKKCQEIFKFLNKEYGSFKELKPVPQKNKKGFLMGDATYLWEIKTVNKSLIVSRGFNQNFTETSKGKIYTQNETLEIYLIDNNVKSDAPGYNDLTTKELLLKTFSS